MVALGFKSKTNKNQQSVSNMDSILADGTVTLEEFNQLMMGEVNGRDPVEEAHQMFVVLSKSDGEIKNDGFITLNKLEAACKEFQVLSWKEDFFLWNSLKISHFSKTGSLSTGAAFY